LKRGTFNAPEVAPVISEVFDTGLFSYREVTPPPGALWDLKLWEPLDLDCDFRVVHGVMGCEPTVGLATQKMILDGADALVKFPDQPCDFLFLAYCGARIGGWWREETVHGARWSERLTTIDDDASVRWAALMMRWGKLPILAERFRANVRVFAHDHPATVLRAWLGESADAGSLSMPEIDEAWLGAIRDIFRDFQPADNCEAIELAECLHRDPAAQCERLVLDTLERLGPVDPILMGRVAKQWICFSQPSADTRQLMRNALLYEWHVEPEFLIGVAKLMGVDDYFLENVPVSDGLRATRGDAPHQPHYLNSALSQRNFRVLLASRIVADFFH
jgi:hypothetical protein